MLQAHQPAWCPIVLPAVPTVSTFLLIFLLLLLLLAVAVVASAILRVFTRCQPQRPPVGG
jgi:hypothetical protein